MFRRDLERPAPGLRGASARRSSSGVALPHLQLAGHGQPLIASGVYTFRARRGKIGNVCPLACGAFGVWITPLTSPDVRPATPQWPALGSPWR